MRVCAVRLGDRSYPVHIGKNLLAESGRHLKRNYPPERWKALIVTQKEIAVFYETAILETLRQSGFEAQVFVTPKAKSSEQAKSLPVYLKLIHTIAQMDGKGKSIFLVALGGGVIGDLTGFAAAVYRRGIPYVQIPTTLTAQVDSSLGGKTGIDLPEGKNLLGVVHQPTEVWSDPGLLNSLSDRHWSEGFAEIIKYGVIKDPELFSLLERYGKEAIRAHSELLEKVIHRCVKIKARIVSQDEYDKKGIRIELNFGHTAGHAIEALSGYTGRYSHGEAVAIGMLVACDMAKYLGLLKETRLPERLEALLIKFQLPVFFKALSVESLMNTMGYDKKTDAGVNRFVLPVSMGKTTVVKNVPAEVIAKALTNRKR